MNGLVRNEGVSMFIQIFRNRISQSSKLKKRISDIESVIRSNINQKERIIVKELTREWNKGGRLHLKPFTLSGYSCNLWIDFHQLPTHGYSIRVKDLVDLDSDRLKYPTEYGDIAIIVDYFFEQSNISRKVSILQTKKEKRQGQADIKLHQLYLMQNWPCVEFPSGTKYKFKGVYPDEFAFYHFVLNYSANAQFSSSVCSAPFVGQLIGANKTFLVNKLKTWKVNKKTKPNLQPPSKTLHYSFLPGSTYRASKTSASYRWQLIPKPFGRFLLDAAYLFVGTNHVDILALTKARVSTILAMKVVGGRGQREDEDRGADNAAQID